MDIYVSINADRMPDATDSLIEGSWERFCCEGCGRDFVVDNRLLYTDLPRRRWIVRYPLAERGRFPALEEEAERVFRTEYLDRPPEPIRQQAAGVRPRICFGRTQLAEKLLTWRSGLDDATVECLKLVLLRDSAGHLLSLGPGAMRLTGVTDDELTLDVIALGDEHPLERFSVPMTAYRRVADDLDRYRHAFPDLFGRAFVDARRYLLER